MSKAVVALQEGIKEVDQGQKAMEMTRLASFPMEDLMERQRVELEAATESLSELRGNVAEARRELEEEDEVEQGSLQGSWGGNEVEEKLVELDPVELLTSL